MLEKSFEFIKKLPNLKNFGPMRTQPLKKPIKKKSPAKWIILLIIVLLIVIKRAKTPGTLIARIVGKVLGK